MRKVILLSVLMTAGVALGQQGPGGGQGGPGGQRGSGGGQGGPGNRQQQNQQNQNQTPAEKAVHECTIEVKDGMRIITSNGVPDHKPGQFPNRGNPNTISAQKYVFKCPVVPKVADAPQEPQRGFLFGVAINGVPFDPGTAEFYNRDRSSGWNYEALSGKINLGVDDSNAHVQPNGAYHYHGIPNGLVKLLAGDKAGKQMTLVGYAADGYPVYAALAYTDPNDPKSPLKEMKASYRVKEGTRPSGPGGKYDGTFVQDMEYAKELGDLDECNGRTGVTPEYPEGTYYYVLTNQYPFIPRKFHGTADTSFRKNDGPGGRRGPGGMNGPGGQGQGGQGPGGGQGGFPPPPPDGGQGNGGPGGGGPPGGPPDGPPPQDNGGNGPPPQQ